MARFLALSERRYPQGNPTYPLVSTAARALNTKVNFNCKSRANCKRLTIAAKGFTAQICDHGARGE